MEVGPAVVNWGQPLTWDIFKTQSPGKPSMEKQCVTRNNIKCHGLTLSSFNDL